MKKITHSSKRKKEAAIKRRYNKFLRNNKDNNIIDRISLLPDEILISIITRLRLREAIATSILSPRWRHLYTRIHHLNFPPVLLPEIPEEFSKYVNNTINHTLDLFTANVSMKEFRVNIHQCLEGANLERWLEFALARRVEIIDIHLCYGTQPSFHYALQLSNLIRGRTLPGLKSLKKLFLCGIHVEDQEVELLLSNFPLLETLPVSNSERLKNVSIVGCGNQGLKLKYLGMSSVRNLKSVEIRDMINLESLTCYGPDKYDLRLTNVPKLTEMRICEFGANELPSTPSCIRDQFRRLVISGDPTLLFIPRFELKNLKQLELKVHMISEYSNHRLQTLFFLVEACTSLESLRVNFKWIDINSEEKIEIEEIDLLPTRKQLSPYLKKFVLSKYLGSREEMEFALFVMNNAPALEQMIVEPCNANPTKQRMATTRARKQFRPVAPSSLNLVINPLTRSKS